MASKCSVSFSPAQDIPSLDGKVILVTGGNIGLGKQCIFEYARHNPSEIWLAARNLEKAKAAVEDIQAELAAPAPIKLLEVDLSSLSSVQQAARKFMAEARRLDILMLNAGIMAAPPSLTTDGYEAQFGTNYLGHALLAKLLLPVMTSTARIQNGDVRILMITSDLHSDAPKEGIRFESLKTDGHDLSSFSRYGQSKLAMILWTRKMARLYPQFTLTAIHPGVVQTNLSAGATDSPLVFRALMKVAKPLLTGVEKGARNQLWASVSKDVKSGEYYKPVGISGGGSKLSTNDELAERLWEWTEHELGSFVA